jgi:pimeloyl-[acyl-carrier protein] synthase
VHLLDLGYPEEAAGQLKQWSSMFFYLFQQIPSTEMLQRLNKSLADFRELTREIVSERRRHPQDDLISRLIHADEGALSEQEIVDNSMLMAADGIENVWSGLVSAVATLLTHESELKKMRDRPELVDVAVEECLRYESPGQYQGRIALEDIQWGNKIVRRYSVVQLVFASANRDPNAFANPDRFDIQREDSSRHLAFGLGRHACRAALRMLFESRAIKLADKNLTWEARPGHRWLAEVPLEIG